MRNSKTHIVTLRFDNPTIVSLKKEASVEGLSVSELIRKKIVVSYDLDILKRIEDKIDKLSLGGCNG